MLMLVGMVGGMIEVRPDKSDRLIGRSGSVNGIDVVVAGNMVVPWSVSRWHCLAKEKHPAPVTGMVPDWIGPPWSLFPTSWHMILRISVFGVL